MTEQSTPNNLEFVLNQIENPIDRAKALCELASKGVHIPREIASEYVIYALFIPQPCWDPRGLNLVSAMNFAGYTGLTELSELFARKIGSDNRFTNEQQYLEAVGLGR